MDEETMRNIMSATVSIACDELTDLELAVLNNVVQLGGSPHDRIFDYEAVKGLFTEENGTRMHEETKLALESVVASRLG